MTTTHTASARTKAAKRPTRQEYADWLVEQLRLWARRAEAAHVQEMYALAVNKYMTFRGVLERFEPSWKPGPEDEIALPKSP